jgi:hypothetical protein
MAIQFFDKIPVIFLTKFKSSGHFCVAYPPENVTKSRIIKKGNDDDMIDWGDSPFWPFLQHSMIHGTVQGPLNIWPEHSNCQIHSRGGLKNPYSFTDTQYFLYFFNEIIFLWIKLRA